MSQHAQRMLQLFLGLEGVHGTHGVPDREGLKWGIKRTARTLRDPVTEELWDKHLRGERPLGVVPIRQDHTCFWGSIDVDQYDTDLMELVGRVDRAKMRLVPCRSKSGGMHLFMFLAEAQPAEALQILLRDMAASLGLAGSEIFPKQTQLLSDRGDAGNWMVMPYFGGDFEGRLQQQVGLKRTGAEMTLGEFLNLAEETRLSTDEFSKLCHRRVPHEGGGGKEPLPFGDGPRCLQHLARDGVPEGNRNNVMFMVGLYCQRKWPDDWKEHLETFNQMMMHPPLNEEEIQSAVRSLERKEYDYTCKTEPMHSHCDAAVCRGRRFGIGETGSYPVIAGLSKLDIPENPLWFVDVEHVRLELETAELQQYHLFQRAALSRGNRMYRQIKQADWVELLAEALKNVVIIDPPVDVGAPEYFRELLEEFLTNRQRGERKEDILAGRPWENEEEQRHYFRLFDLVRFLQREGMREVKRGELCQRLRKLGGDAHFFNIKGKGVNVWWVPTESVVETPELDVPHLRSQVIT